MQIYIHRDNEDFGPYTREFALEYLKQGIFQATDYAWSAGQRDWKPVGELLGLSAPAASAVEPSHTARTQPLTGLTGDLSQPPPPRRTRKRIPRPPKKAGSLMALNIALILLAAAIGYAKFGPHGAVLDRPVPPAQQAVTGAPAAPAALQPAPADTAPAAPAVVAADVPAPPAPIAAVPAANAPAAAATPALAPVPLVAAAATPVPAILPVAAATPPPPAPFDPAALARTPAAWPKTVTLKADAVFPAVYNAQVIGSVTVPRGTVVNLVDVLGDDVDVEFHGGTQKLSWKATDLEERAGQANGASPVMQTAAPSGPAPAFAAGT